MMPVFDKDLGVLYEKRKNNSGNMLVANF